MEAAQRIDRGNNTSNNTNKEADVAHTAAAVTVTTSGLSSINTSNSAPYLSDDELVSLQLKGKNENNDFAPVLKLPKGNVNKKTLKNV